MCHRPSRNWGKLGFDTPALSTAMEHTRRTISNQLVLPDSPVSSHVHVGQHSVSEPRGHTDCFANTQGNSLRLGSACCAVKMCVGRVVALYACTRGHVVSCRVMSCHVVSCDVRSCHVMPYHATRSCHVNVSYVISYLSCYVMAHVTCKTDLVQKAPQLADGQRLSHEMRFAAVAAARRAAATPCLWKRRVNHSVRRLRGNCTEHLEIETHKRPSGVLLKQEKMQPPATTFESVSSRC